MCTDFQYFFLKNGWHWQLVYIAHPVPISVWHNFILIWQDWTQNLPKGSPMTLSLLGRLLHLSLWASLQQAMPSSWTGLEPFHRWTLLQWKTSSGWKSPRAIFPLSYRPSVISSIEQRLLKYCKHIICRQVRNFPPVSTSPGPSPKRNPKHPLEHPENAQKCPENDPKYPEMPLSWK